MDESMLAMLDSLSKHHYDTIAQSLRTALTTTSLGIERSGLSRRKFKTLLAITMDVKEQDKTLALICKKIDYNGDGIYTEEKFLDYVLYYLKEKEGMEIKTSIVIHGQPKFIRNIFSKDGIITTWSPSLAIQKCNIADQTASVFTQPYLGGPLRRPCLWVTDATLLVSANILVVATTSRELVFYDVSSSVYKCKSKLSKIPHVVLCLTSHTNSSGSAYVIYGDDNGSIVTLLFNTPSKSLFFRVASKNNTSQRPTNNELHLQTVSFSRLVDHSKYVTMTMFERSHPDWVNRVMYVPQCNSIISCSNSSEQSLIIRHLANKHRPYVFNIFKGISSFDYSHQLELLVTGSLDHVVRFWNPYVTARPTAVFTHHQTPLVDVLIHRELGVVFSFSRDATLCVWAVREYALLQSISIKFPFSQRKPEYDHQVLSLVSPSFLTISNNEYIGTYALTLKTAEEIRGCGPVTSHAKPLTAAVFDSLYFQVVSGCEGGDVIVWDFTNGAKLLKIKEAHGEREITCLTMDSRCRRVLTGSSDGEVKVWNHVTGDCMKHMRVRGGREVTGLVHHIDKEKIFVTGWNKRISIFPDIANVHIFNLRQEQTWSDPQQHREDITTMVLCYPFYLATGSFDGGIVVWNTETETTIIKTRTVKSSHPNVSPYCHARAKRSSSRHAPIDSLLFLKTRMLSQFLHQGVLVSSEEGVARFWTLRDTEPIGSFSMMCDVTSGDGKESDHVLAFCVDSKDKFLIAGNMKGSITVFDISKFCNGKGTQNATPPDCLATWKAHSGTVVSVEHITYRRQSYVISASTDCTVRLWNIKGHYIGTFGQEQKWDILDVSTYQHPKTPFCDEITICDTKASSTNVEGADNVSVSDVPDDNCCPGSNENVGKKIADEQSPSVVDKTAISFDSVLDKNLYKQYGERMDRRLKIKTSRRKIYSEINPESIDRIGQQCSPYQALKLADITV